VFENGVLRTILGSKRVEVAGGLRTLHNKEIHNFYSSPNIVGMIKPRNEMSRAYSTYEKMTLIVLVESSEGRRRLGKSRDSWRIILKRILIRIGGCELDSVGSKLGPVAGSCEHGNEPSCYIKCWEILD
jgi:hypothetical protein